MTARCVEFALTSTKQPCLEAAALNSTCLLGDMACYCLDDAFQQAAGECIKQSCSIVQDMLGLWL